MTTDWTYSYPTLYSGILRNRYKRFLADIEPVIDRLAIDRTLLVR